MCTSVGWRVSFVIPPQAGGHQAGSLLASASFTQRTGKAITFLFLTLLWRCRRSSDAGSRLTHRHQCLVHHPVYSL